MHIEVTDTPEGAAHHAADIVCAAVRQRPDVTIGLPSGKTPLRLYDELARRVGEGSADLRNVVAFAIDELHGVPRDHPATNASYFSRRLTNRVRLRALHVLDSQSDQPAAECERFQRLIEEAGGLDLVVLGIGVNGHIAFNEPGTPFDARARRVQLAASTRAAYADAFGSFDSTPQFGLTLGLADLMASRAVLLLASGRGKAEVVAQALEGPVTEELPASLLQRHRQVTAVLDREAAAQLSSERAS